METKPLLMGFEVEYSMAISPRHSGRSHSSPHMLLLNAIRAEHHWLPDIRGPGGCYIDNAARYYLDSGNHNEFCSPELSSPRQIAVYDRATEQILLRAKGNLLSDPDPVDICITKNNLNFTMPDRATWGQHEAYTCWIPLEDAAPQLIPYLVSRIPYAGAGYLSGHGLGVGFELSQRARHMTRPQGAETTTNRAIFCTRAWKSSDVSSAGWTRTNLISKDSQRCSFGMYLSFGVMGLLMMITNEGHRIGGRVQLQDPVAAMRAISLDPWLRTDVELADGRRATAIDIQRAYLAAAKPHVESGEYPEWTEEVFEHWTDTVEQLANDPLRLGDRLDTYLKLRIFDRQLRRAALTWHELQQALNVLTMMRSSVPESIISAILNDDASHLDRQHVAMFRRWTKNRDVKRVGLDHLRFAVRLQAVELNYHELGGLFDQLDAAGAINHVVVTPDEVSHAIHHPPTGGRAEARGQAIREFHGQPWACDWEFVISQAEEEWVDLRDPFTNTWEVTPCRGQYPGRRRPSSIEALLARIAE